MSQFPVNVLYSQSNGLHVQPDELVVAKNASGKIVWNPNGDVEAILGIHIDGWPHAQPTPDAGRNTWSVDDPNRTAATYKYSVRARITGVGDEELDPEIVNRGVGGGP